LGRAPRRFAKAWSTIRGSLLVLYASLIIWLGTAGIQTPPSHAASTAVAANPVISRTRWSPSLDQIVQDYVQDRMFDDDVYDPVESIYRETIDDNIKGTHPKALKEITSTVLGRDVVKAQTKASAGSAVANALNKVIAVLRNRGLSEAQAIALLTGSVFLGVPYLILNVVLALAYQNKHSITNVMKKRYGDAYTVDATIKEEDDVELPDEDDDDDDNDGGGDDDDK
jgi:hypothetical protein